MAACARHAKLTAEVSALEHKRASPPRCEQCGEVIGVYEPLFHVLDGVAVETSRAAQSELSYGARGSYYHARCYEQPAPAR